MNASLQSSSSTIKSSEKQFRPEQKKRHLTYTILACYAHYKHHTLEIRGLCLMKGSIEMPQNLGYFWSTKTYIHSFLYPKNMANFEAFRWILSSSINLLFLKSDTWIFLLICVRLVIGGFAALISFIHNFWKKYVCILSIEFSVNNSKKLFMNARSRWLLSLN